MKVVFTATITFDDERITNQQEAWQVLSDYLRDSGTQDFDIDKLHSDPLPEL